MREFLQSGDSQASMRVSPVSKMTNKEYFAEIQDESPPFQGGMKPTTGYLSTLVATAGVR